MNAVRLLAMCAAMVALAAAGCGTSGSDQTAGSGSGATPTASARGTNASPSPSALAGANALPSWATGLGSGVTLEDPTFKPEAGTPEATVNSYIYALITPNPGSACTYIIPSRQADCRSALARAAQQGQDITFSYNSFELGYTAVDGSEALVGSTYTQFCTQAEAQTCAPDLTNPKTVFDSGKPFAELWTQTLHPTRATGQTFSPIPCVEINGKWYVDALSA